MSEWETGGEVVELVGKWIVSEGWWSEWISECGGWVGGWVSG